MTTAEAITYFDKPKKVYIYTIALESEPEKVLYVGKTENPIGRFSKHRQMAFKNRNNHTHKELGKHLDNGDKLLFDIIDEVTYDKWEEAEKGYIKFFQSAGANLLNRTSGGKDMKYKGNPRPYLNRPVAMLDNDGNVLKEFESISSVAVFFNKEQKTTINQLCRTLRGDRANYMGYKWIRL